MEAQRNPGRGPLEYGVGGLVVLVVSIGVAAIVYAVNIVPFDAYNLLAWVFGPLGVYTLAYSLIARKDYAYYLVWGSVMFAVGGFSAFYNRISPFVVLGILLIVVAVIAIVVYERGKK
jgi:hypothetical protein